MDSGYKWQCRWFFVLWISCIVDYCYCAGLLRSVLVCNNGDYSFNNFKANFWMCSGLLGYYASLCINVTGNVYKCSKNALCGVSDVHFLFYSSDIFAMDWWKDCVELLKVHWERYGCCITTSNLKLFAFYCMLARKKKEKKGVRMRTAFLLCFLRLQLYWVRFSGAILLLYNRHYGMTMLVVSERKINLFAY